MPGMEVFSWFKTHGFDLLQSVGIIAGLCFTAWSLRVDAKVRRVANLLTITEHHRDIWTRIYERPELTRVLEETVDPKSQPVTPQEELFVLLIVLHLSSAQEAMKQGMFPPPDGLRKDIEWFFSRPIPKVVWEKIRPFQDADFVEFIESFLRKN